MPCLLHSPPKYLCISFHSIAHTYGKVCVRCRQKLQRSVVQVSGVQIPDQPSRRTDFSSGYRAPFLTGEEYWPSLNFGVVVSCSPSRRGTRHASRARWWGVTCSAPVCTLMSRILLKQCYLVKQIREVFQSRLTDSRKGPAGSNKEKQIKDVDGWRRPRGWEYCIWQCYSLLICLSVTSAGCDNYFCPSQQTWMMELSFLLPFVINMTAIQYVLAEENFKGILPCTGSVREWF